MNVPLVSCIMPTANRQKYIPFSIKYFLDQDYPNKELIIIDDGRKSVLDLIPEFPQIKYFYSEPIGSIGLKRNYACERCSGEIIMHWDDDDWYANDWITQQVNFLTASGADICGIEQVNFFSTLTDTLWVGTAKNRNNPNRLQPWLNGPTIAYWKSFWENHPFKDLAKAEDDDFIKFSGAKIYAHDYIDGFVAVLHPYNTSIKYFEGPVQKFKS